MKKLGTVKGWIEDARRIYLLAEEVFDLREEVVRLRAVAEDYISDLKRQMKEEQEEEEEEEEREPDDEYHRGHTEVDHGEYDKDDTVVSRAAKQLLKKLDTFQEERGDG